MRMPRTSSFSVRDILDLPKSAAAANGTDVGGGGGGGGFGSPLATATATAHGGGSGGNTNVSPSAAHHHAHAMAAAAAAAAANYGATELYMAQQGRTDKISFQLSFVKDSRSAWVSKQVLAKLF